MRRERASARGLEAARALRERIAGALGGDAASVVVVAVFGLGGVFVFADSEDGGIAKDCKGVWRRFQNCKEVTFIGDFFSGENDVGEIEPSVAIWIRNRFDEFMGKCAVCGVNELAVGSARADAAAVHVLERLNGVEDMADVAKIDTVVVGAESEAA